MLNLPAPVRTTVPADAVPSPQLMLAVRSAAASAALASVMVATTPLKSLPVAAEIAGADAPSTASVTLICTTPEPAIFPPARRV